LALVLKTAPRLKSGIYKITCIITGKVYIGSSINIEKRWLYHKEDLRKDRHRNQILQRAWEKYGSENFKFEVVEYIPEEALIEKEQYYIDLYKAADKKYGYNICPAAGTTRGVKRPNANWGRVLSDETKQKIANSLSGFKHSPEAKANMSAARKGKKRAPMSEEQKQRLSEAKRGTHPNISPEKRRELSERMKGNKFSVGLSPSEETREKLRVARKGRTPSLGMTHTEEARAKISVAHKGKSLQPEHRAKIAAAHMGKKQSAEHRKNLALSQAKLTPEKINNGLQWREQGMRIDEICRELSCSRQTFYNAINGKFAVYRKEVAQ
jgi:group I intron endonuclease